MEIRIVRISDEPSKIDEAARWFHEKWWIPDDAYQESMEGASKIGVPEWYLCLCGEKLIGGMDVIENDFHPRKDLAPNVCAVDTEGLGRGRETLSDVRSHRKRNLPQTEMRSVCGRFFMVGFFDWRSRSIRCSSRNSRLFSSGGGFRKGSQELRLRSAPER